MKAATLTKVSGKRTPITWRMADRVRSRRSSGPTQLPGNYISSGSGTWLRGTATEQICILGSSGMRRKRRRHWVAEMARCVKGTGEFSGKAAEPYGHLVSTTYGTDEVWRIPEIDYTQTHSYGTGNIPDHGTVVHKEALAHAAFGKPHLMAEFGIDWRSPDNKYDPDGKGINLHNALWASALSGEAGGAMIWWWDNYIHPTKLYPHFEPLAKFAQRVPWT